MAAIKTNNNSKPKKKEVSKNPNQVSKPYVCSVCKNSESIRNNASLEANTESLLNKLNTANEAFRDSMSKVESLSLSLRHFIISNSEEAESSQAVLLNLQKDISDFTDRSKTLHDQILRNETIHIS